MKRETYEENMQFMEDTLKRIEQNSVSIDELETLASEFAQARQFCAERLTRIETALQDALQVGEQAAAAAN